MKTILPFVSLCALLLAGCEPSKPAPASDKPAEKKPEPGSTFGSTISAPVDYLDAVNKGRKTAENTIDTTALTQAINMFHTTEGRYPKDLQELVKEGMIKEVPKDRYGRQLVYDAKTGTVRVDPKPPEPAAK
jgi:hypothetical protein